VSSQICVTIISEKFEGLSPVARHRLVLKALWQQLERDVHAVDYIVAKTPGEMNS
jgi:BolA-like protein 1